MSKRVFLSCVDVRSQTETSHLMVATILHFTIVYHLLSGYMEDICRLFELATWPTNKSV